jgi:hypothetical protein
MASLPSTAHAESKRTRRRLLGPHLAQHEVGGIAVFANPSSQSAFRSLAHATHAQLGQGLSEVARTQGARAQWAAWLTLEGLLLSHLRAEEELLLPDFDLVLSGEAAHLREEHQRIRELMVQAGTTLCDTRIDATLLVDLGKRISRCAAHEERVLYPWAERYLRPRKKGEFVQRSTSLLSATAR